MPPFSLSYGRRTTPRPRSQVVRRRSAKPLFGGSNPPGASNQDNDLRRFPHHNTSRWERIWERRPESSPDGNTPPGSSLSARTRSLRPVSLCAIVFAARARGEYGRRLKADGRSGPEGPAPAAEGVRGEERHADAGTRRSSHSPTLGPSRRGDTMSRHPGTFERRVRGYGFIDRVNGKRNVLGPKHYPELRGELSENERIELATRAFKRLQEDAERAAVGLPGPMPVSGLLDAYEADPLPRLAPNTQKTIRRPWPDSARSS